MRAFPVVYATDVERTARFWERLGFSRYFQLPEEGAPGYVGLRRADPEAAVVGEVGIVAETVVAEVAVIAAQWPKDQYGVDVGSGPRFEMFVYVAHVDDLIGELRAEGVSVLRDAADMPWGERVGFIADPDGNPVALANKA